MNLPPSKIEKEKTNHEVQADKTDEREDSVTGGNDLTVAFVRSEQAIDQPGLST